MSHILTNVSDGDWPELHRIVAGSIRPRGETPQAQEGLPHYRSKGSDDDGRFDWRRSPFTTDPARTQGP